MSQAKAELSVARDVFIPLGKAQLEGELNIPGEPAVLCFSRTGAEAAAIVRGISTLREPSTVPL